MSLHVPYVGRCLYWTSLTVTSALTAVAFVFLKPLIVEEVEAEAEDEAFRLAASVVSSQRQFSTTY